MPARIGPRVLVAEEDVRFRTELCSALARDGYEVVAVRDGTELVEYIGSTLLEERDSVDLMISGVRMPGWTGLQALAALRSVDWTIPVILMTTDADDDIAREARRLGAAYMFEKPFEVDDLCMAARCMVPPS
ncbi:MAG: response regulator [Deltaproteobacteria bacterium]|nr:response regulator [Deltaproteobacteria bacterium]